MLHKRYVFVVGILLLTFWGCEKEYNWNETFNPRGEQPYDLSIFYQLSKKKAQKWTDLKGKISTSLDTSLQNSTYLFIGNQYFMDSTDWSTLERFAEKGNFVTIISPNYPYLSKDTLFPPFELDVYNDSIIRVSLDTDYCQQPSPFKLNRRNAFNNIFNSWMYASFLPHGFYQPMGWIYEDKCNFWRHTKGKGAFIYHTTPLCFTNYALDTEDGFKYCNNAMSKILRNHIVWDEYSGSEIARMMNTQRDSNTMTPLVYILSQPALKAAWFLLLAGVLLYLIFGGKRRQRPIPVWNKPGNMALGFIKNVGALYLEEKSFKELAMMEIRSFHAFMLERFKISPSEIQQEATIKLLEQRTKVREKTWRDIFRQITITQNADQITEADLHRIYNAIENLKSELI